MLRRDPIYQATTRELLASGLMPDLHPMQTPLWEAGVNAVFSQGKVTRRVPSSLVFTAGTTAGEVKGLSQQRLQNGTRYIWAAGKTALDTYRLVRWYGPAPEVIASGLLVREDESLSYETDFVDFAHWGDWTLWTTGHGAIGRHKPGVGVDTLVDAPVDVVKILKKLNFLLAIGFGGRGTAIAWSAADDIDTWIGTTENEAGELNIDDFDTRIKTAHRLGQHISVFSEDQMGLVTFTNAPYYFGQRVVLDGIGACGKFSVAGDGNMNFGVGRNGIWWSDSSTFKYIDEGMLRGYLQEQVNWSQAGKITAARNDITNCWDFHFPMRESLVNDECWSFDPRNGGWSQAPAAAVQQERKLLKAPLVGNAVGEVRLLGDNPDIEAALDLRTRPLLMQLRSQFGMEDCHTDSRVDEVELLVKAAVGVEFRVESAERIEGPYEETSWIAVEARGATYRLPNLPSGVYHRLAFRSVVTDWQLDLQGFLLFGSVEGSKRDAA